ncbi:unnamed protein product, partial [Laminaria digitata]
ITSSFNTVVGPAGGGTTITINNAGTIEDAGSSTAITTGGSILLTNSGIISGGQRAIFVDTITSLINSGNITSSSSDAIRADTISSLINSGSITSRDSIGIFVNDTISNLLNSGTITSNTNAIIGATISSLINNGTITGRLTGIVAGGDITSLTNSGIITSSTNYAIRADTITSLTNGGTITGGTYAIWENGAGNTQLTLLAGSVIEGDIDLGGGINMLSVGPGLSLATTIEELDAVGSTSDSPFVTDVTGVNTLVVVVDPTSFGLTDERLADLTGGIFGVLSSRQSG